MRVSPSAVALALAATGCGLVPWVSYGEAPPECLVFEPGTPMEWTGHGHPVALGLLDADPTDADRLPVGNVYVGMATEHDPVERVFCVIPDPGQPPRPDEPMASDDYYWGLVPEGWTPP